MSDENNFSIEDLENKIDLLIKRFDEQKGIIDSYVHSCLLYTSDAADE